MPVVLEDDHIFAYEPVVALEVAMPGDARGGPAPLRGQALAAHSAAQETLEQTRRCKFCSADLDSKDRDGMYSNSWFSHQTRWCSGCGWWVHAEREGGIVGSFEPDQDLSDVEPLVFRLFEPVLTSFAVDSVELPVDVLRRELSRRPEVVRHIHPRKFEQLAADIFRDFLNCEVRLTAQSHDGGVDLYLVESNSVSLVQLKRRQGLAAEGVSTVRELAGVLLASGHPKGVVLTTAPRYSREALAFADAVRQRNVGQVVELLDYSDLLRIVDVIDSRATSAKRPWDELMSGPSWTSAFWSKLAPAQVRITNELP